jgi:hypothetical protein
MPNNATGWLGSRFGGATPGPIQNFTTAQQALQAHFAGLLPNIANAVTRRVVKKGIYRVGKLLWAASTPVHANGARFGTWSKTKRSTNSEQNIQMNCWEGVLYLAYQCDAITKAACVNFYQSATASDTKLRNLFGTAAVYNPPAATPNMGDLLTFEDANHVVNHVAIYVGVSAGTHYALHNLSYNGVTTGLQMGGGFHFEDMASLVGRYGGNVTVYYTTPFWVAGSPTHAYYSAL